VSIDNHRRAVERHQANIARFLDQKSREVQKAATEAGRANAAVDAAGRTSSASTAQSKLRAAQRHRDRATRHEKKIADLEKKIASEQKRLNDAKRRLGRAEDEAARKNARERARAQRDHEERMKRISSTLTEHQELHQVALSALEKLQQLPAEITVLFLASNPIDQAQLRLDEEVRAIQEMIRKSEHRDAVKLESRWAVRPMDVLQAINECEPRVIHFSGHGSEQEEIILQDKSGAAQRVSKEAIVQTMVAASGEIQVVFFNACYSRAQAEAVVEHVPAAIGMNTAIGDEAARVFSAQFYSAIGFGLSIGTAFEQARAALMLEGISEELTPELFLTPGLDEGTLVLVQSAKQEDPQAEAT
jgi:hypothetical protein